MSGRTAPADSLVQDLGKAMLLLYPKRIGSSRNNMIYPYYRERCLLECFFGKIKRFRKLFSRFDKTAEISLGFLNFVGVLIWLR
jgi:transposase